MTEEKREELSIMEIAIRRQMSEVKQKEDQLKLKEEELKMQKDAQLQEIQEHKEAIIEERKWLESVREDVDINFNKNKQ